MAANAMLVHLEPFCCDDVFHPSHPIVGKCQSSQKETSKFSAFGNLVPLDFLKDM